MKHLLRTALLAGLLVPSIVAAQEISTPTHYIPQAFDVLSYEVYMDLTNAPSLETTANCDIVLRWVSDPSGGFYFHLRSLEIDSVFYDGAMTTATAVGTPADWTYHYVVPAPSSAAVGDTAHIRVYYHGTMTNEGGNLGWGGVSSDNGVVYGLGASIDANYVSATEHWLACYDHPSDKATFTGHFLARRPNVVASNGVESTTVINDSIALYNWHTDIPTATYLLTFACGPYQRLDFDSADVPMVVYSQPADTTATRASFSMLHAMVAAYEQRFGKYPFEKVGYCNTRKGAMEHQTMISIPESISRSGDPVNRIGAHELSHQWFGDLVTPYDYRDTWLNESFAAWCEAIWSEARAGFPSYLSLLEGKASTYFATDANNEGIIPLYDYPHTPPSSNYPQTIYDKGAVVVGMLRYELGDSLMFGALREYLSRYYYGSVTTDDLRSVLEEYSGKSLQWFFDEWVVRPGWPRYHVTVAKRPSPGGYQRATITCDQSPIGTTDYFDNVPLEIEFRDSTGSSVYRIIRAGGASSTVVVDSLPDFSQVTVNHGPTLRALVQIQQVDLVIDTNSSVPVARNRGDIAVKVIPNPAHSDGADLSVIITGVDDCANVRYALYDSAGKEIAKGTSDTCAFRISASELDDGFYILHIDQGFRTSNVSIVVDQ